MQLKGLILTLACTGGMLAPVQAQDTPHKPIVIGAKSFTEQELLGELVAQLIERRTELPVERRFGLGGTDICHAAIISGELDIYVEYTGTALLNVLQQPVISNPDLAYRVVSTNYRQLFDLEWLPPIGFNNTYAIAVRSSDANSNDWQNISDLATGAAADTLTAGFTSEFMERPDGYPGLREAYGFEFGQTIDLDPGLMYQALDQGQVDVICAFATDGRIEEYQLTVLDDDRGFFPPYDAAPIVRGDLLKQHPILRDVLASLAGTISDDAMRQMNYAVDVQKQEPAEVAHAWIEKRLGSTEDRQAARSTLGTEPEVPGLLRLAVSRRGELADKTLEHIILTGAGTLIAAFFGIPLGILIHRYRKARAVVLALTEIVQTIPSLAMLAFLFALYGMLGAVPAVTALMLYALLPIVLNCYTGLNEVPKRVTEAADAVGMSSWQRLRMVELPLAAPVIMAGIRAATVLTVGIATLSTYIGAGGLGDYIARGLARNDTRLTLLGAIPAAALAIILSLSIQFIERTMRRTS